MTVRILVTVSRPTGCAQAAEDAGIPTLYYRQGEVAA